MQVAETFSSNVIEYDVLAIESLAPCADATPLGIAGARWDGDWCCLVQLHLLFKLVR